MAATGLRPTEDLLHILTEAWEHPFTTKSNLAKAWADEVAQAASLGLITTRKGQSLECTRAWRITSRGLALLWDNKLKP